MLTFGWVISINFALFSDNKMRYKLPCLHKQNTTISKLQEYYCKKTVLN